MKEKLENELTYQDNRPQIDVPVGNSLPVVLKSKLLIVDLAGSERIDKSGLFLKLSLKVCTYWHNVCLLQDV